MTEGQTDTSYDFGFVPQRGSIGNSVWLDEDGDGVQDAGEGGIAGLTVTLSGTDPYGNSVSLTTVTGADGGYVFNDLLPGTYTVTVNGGTPPSGMVQTFDPDGAVDNQAVVVLAAGQEQLGTDFGYNWTTDPTTNTGNGSIGDRLWIDADGDGVQDAGEAGLSGVTVQLFSDPNNDGIYDVPVGATQTTDADGSYVFDNVPPGAYQVVVNGGVTPAGYAATGDPDAAKDNRTNVVLAPGDVFVNADFGYDPTAGSTIGDLIFIDPNGNGVQDAGEPGIAGVTVTLLNAGNQVVATAVTNAVGPVHVPGPAGRFVHGGGDGHEQRAGRPGADQQPGG